MNEPFEILKNLLFFTLFASMINFWIEFIFFQKAPPISKKFQLGTINQVDADAVGKNFIAPDFALSSELSSAELPQDQKSISFLQDSGSEPKGLHQRSWWNFPYSTGHIFFIFSFLFLSFDLIFRWFLSKHFPLSNLYESLVFLNWSLLVFFFLWNENPRFASGELDSAELRTKLSSKGNSEPENWIFLPIFAKVLKRFEIKKFTSFQLFFGAILSSVLLFLQSFADWQLPDDMRTLKPLIPALQSNWLLMHVSIMILSYAALFIGCLLAIVYLFLDFFASMPEKSSLKQSTLLTQTSLTQFAKAEPTESTSTVLTQKLFDELDEKSSQILSFAFPLLTLGILSGAIWANEAWGSYWSWDPKETWAFITWLVFAFYIHTRLQKGWRGKYSAIVASFGFFIVWICYLGVNLLGQGLHSYGWISTS
jgi:cytochrome c-type biogenesis protein CcsB